MDALRVRRVNDAPVRGDASHILYWMTAARRAHHNFALDRAVEHAEALGLPLVVLEALRVAYPWASDRLHGFVLDGMAANARAFARTAVLYHPYVEPEAGAGAGLLEALAADAAIVVTDDYPCFFLPRMLAAAARMLPVRLEAVDGNGLLPIAAADRDYPTAYAFRRFLQKSLPSILSREGALPEADPLRRLQARPEALPRIILERWPAAAPALLEREPGALSELPIDHAVGLSKIRGGAEAARRRLRWFLDGPIDRYGDEHNHPDADAASGLSPYLHFGHLSAHDVFLRVLEREGASASKLDRVATGKREGWWGLSPSVEAFLDEIVTWRELGFNHCARNPASYDRYESLPAWARATLEKHAKDRRPKIYTRAELEAAETGDEVWNAAQRELLREGRIHNYLRMLWGKKILEWSPSPRAALQVLVELNNRWALDGRDPNSYSGIFWVLGRYDRPWAPERRIFGQIRYMSSTNTLKKLRLKAYLARYGA